MYLVSQAFVEQVQQKVTDQATVLEIPRSQRHSLACPLAEYQETIADTREDMATAYATGAYTLQEIATCFGVHDSTVSREVRRAEQNGT